MSTSSKKIIINADDYETRIATLENGQLVDLLLERPEQQRMLGNIYKGTVQSIHKGMQAAFIDLGQEMNAFLYVDDIEEAGRGRPPRPGKPRPGEQGRKEGGRSGGRRRKIEDVLKHGQQLLVQVTKEPIGTKGPRVTSKISIPGRYSVLVPHEDYIGISKRIEEKKERKRLRELVAGHKQAGYGIIVRTEGEGMDERDLVVDLQALQATWQGVDKTAQGLKGNGLVYKDLGITLSFVRDSFSDQIEEIVVDSRTVYKEVTGYLKRNAPHLASRLRLYKERLPIFDHYQLEEEIDKMLKRKVWIKKGGYLIIDRTEAMTTIDVNSGRYSGTRDHQKSILEINRLAVAEIVRQIRLRDIGGLIVIDFIDMANLRNRKAICDEMTRELKSDKAKCKILPINPLGVMVISRQRVKESIPHTLSQSCPTCEGLGRILSKETIANKLERGVKKFKAEHREKTIDITIPPSLRAFLDTDRITQWQRQYRLKINVQDNPEFKYHQFEIKGVGRQSRLMAILDSFFQ